MAAMTSEEILGWLRLEIAKQLGIEPGERSPVPAGLVPGIETLIEKNKKMEEAIEAGLTEMSDCRHPGYPWDDFYAAMELMALSVGIEHEKDQP